MQQVLLRATFLLRRPAVLLVALAIAGGGVGLVFLPLFEVPGYELSSALALGVGLLGGTFGVAAGFQERRMIQGREPRPRGAIRFDSPLRSVAAATSAALVLSVAVLIPPLVASLGRALLSSRCDPFAAIGFFPLLTLPSAAIASACGVFCGLFARRAGWAALFYFLLVLASAAVTAWPLLFGPQAFAYNHFGGFLPGPLYDEALAVRPGLLWFRVQTLAGATFVALLAAFSLDMREGKITRPHFRPGAVVLLAGVGLSIAALEERAPALGTRMSDGFLREKLGGLRESEHFVVTFPRGKPREEVDRLVRDLEFHYAQLSRFFGGAPEGKIRVWVYKNAAEKQALVGAAHTQFAKPWRLELHINDAPFPHPVLRHELAHVMSAPFGSGPFRITSRFGVWPNVGVIEGMAVAADDPVDELTLHEWSAGMRRQKLMPDIRRLLDPKGFYGAAPSRAYTAAGSFLRYLGDTYGPSKLRALYARGDFDSAYGRSLDSLAAEWEKFLDSVPLDEGAVHLAFARFRRGSLFARACAREVATLQGEASELVHSDPERAAVLYRRCAELQPEEPGFRLGEASALARADRGDEAAAVLAKLSMQVKDRPSLAAEVAMAQADVAFARGRLDEARGFLDQALGLKVSPTVDRTARVKLAALESKAIGPAIWSYFRAGRDEVKLLVLREALQAEPRNPFVSYLLGRRLVQGQEPTLALRYLEEALSGSLPDSIRREALRLKLEAEYLAGDCAAVRTTAGRLPGYGASFKSIAQRWLDRCELDQRSFNGPLVPAGPFK